MSTTAMDKPSSELKQLPDSNRPHIRKAFNLLKTHAAAVATFTLQWQDLEDHLQSINDSIQSKLYHLQNPTPAVDNPSATFNGIPIGDGDKLARHLRERVKDHDAIRDSLRGALAASQRPGELVIEAVAGLLPPAQNPSGNAAANAEVSAVYKTRVLLLEEFAKAKPEIGDGVREEAVRVAKEWKRIMNVKNANSLEVLGFLTLLDAFGLVGEFDSDDLVSLIGIIVQRKQSIELFRSLGLSEKASDFIQNLISQKKSIQAVRFICTFELVDKFPPVPLLRSHVNDARKAANTISNNNEASPKEKDDAMHREIHALVEAVRSIEMHKLESDFPPEELKQRIELLRNQKKEKKAKEKAAKSKAPAPSSQPRQLTGNKRAFPDTRVQPNNPHNGNRHPWTGPARAPAGVHPIHNHRPVRFSENEGREYLVPPAVMSAPNHSTHHHRSLGLLESEASQYQRAQYSPLYYKSAHSPFDPRSGLPSGSRGLTASPTQRVSAAHYGLSGSRVSAEHIRSLDEQYGANATASGRTREFGHSRDFQGSDPSPGGSLAYYPADPPRAAGRGERPLPSSGSDYELLSKCNVLNL